MKVGAPLLPALPEGGFAQGAAPGILQAVARASRPHGAAGRIACFQGDTGTQALRAVMNQLRDPERGCTHCGRCGNRQHPRPHNPRRHSPAHRRETGCSSYADNCACNRVRGADWNSGKRRGEQSDRAGGFGAEPSHRLELGDPRSHRVDDSPTTEICTRGNRSVRR
jgi:hypothetical protein